MIGSHNTFTYLKPRRWWQRLWNFAARCQSKDIAAQYAAGARLFDLRLVCKGERVWLAHTWTDYELPMPLEELFETYADCGWRIVREKGDMDAFKRVVSGLMERHGANVREVYEGRDTWKIWCFGDFPVHCDVHNYSRQAKHWWQMGIRWPWVENRGYAKPTEAMMEMDDVMWCDFVGE